MKKLSVFSLFLLLILTIGAFGPTAAQDNRPITMASLVELYTMDPAVGMDQAIGSSLKQVYDALFRYVGNPPKAEPWLADSFTTSADGKTYTIKLNPKAVFHDDSPVNADAVVYSAERLLRINQGPAGLFAGILSPGSSKAVDATTVEFTLDQAYGPFPDILTWLFIVDPAVVEANKGSDDGVTYLTDHDAGSGPFTMGEWKPGESYQFVAVPDYWKGWPSAQYPTSVLRLVQRETSTRRQSLESGQVDMVDWMSIDDINAIDGQNGMKAAPGPTLTVYDVKMNTVHGPTADANLRRAIAYATNYADLDAIWGGHATPLTGPLPPSLTSLSVPVYTTDLDKARAELAKSAYAGGAELTYVYVTGLEDERRTGLVLLDSLSKIGIKVTLQDQPWADAVASFSNPETAPDLFPLYSSTGFADPDNYLWSAFHSSQAGQWTNPGHYKNAEVDKLLEQARASTDAAARMDLYAQAEAAIVADSPNIFVAATPEDHVVGPRLVDYSEHYSPVMGSMEDFYFYAVGA